jgi:hypothetical protein
MLVRDTPSLFANVHRYKKSNASSAQALLFENYHLALAPVVANAIANNPILRLTNDTSKALQFTAVAGSNGQPGLEIIPLPKKRSGPELALVGKSPVRYFGLVEDPRRAERRIGRPVLYQDWWSEDVEGQRVLSYRGIENGVVMMNGYGAENALLNWVDGMFFTEG